MSHGTNNLNINRYEILVDHSETANKCTIMPLFYREDFAIRRVASSLVLPAFNATILLHPDGESLDQVAATSPPITSIALIDCVWRRLDPLLLRLEKPLPRLVKIPASFVTAYPRKSRLEVDPEGGLATIEALFIAAALCGTWDVSLLNEYFFGSQFIELNREAFAKCGINTAAQEPALFRPKFQRTAFRRRIYRGRAGTANY